MKDLIQNEIKIWFLFWGFTIFIFLILWVLVEIYNNYKNK